MADLDDFFAKKDRKKNKGKKFATTDDLAKKLEETAKKSEKIKKEKMTTTSVPTTNLAQDISVDETSAPAFKDEDEWKEFTEEKKDYSGLKIQHLQISENDVLGNGDQDDSNDDGLDESGNERESGNRRKGPWKVISQPEESSEPVKPVEQPPPPPTAQEKSTGKYIPPSQRNAAKILEKAAPLKTPSKKSAAPDLKSDEMFPTLSASKKSGSVNTSAWGKKKVDDVPARSYEESRPNRMSSYSRPSTNSDSGRLSLGNKYNSLHNNQS